MNNYDEALRLESEALNSSGLAMNRYGIYTESVAAKSKTLQATWESLWQTLIKGDAIKTFNDILIKIVGTIDNLINSFGLLQAALFTLFSVLVLTDLKGFALFLTNIGKSIHAITLWGKALGAQKTAMQFLTGSIDLLGKSLASLVTNPVTWYIAAIGVVVAGIISWVNWQNKLIKQTESLERSQTSFNKALQEYMITLDKDKIDAVTTSLINFKNAINYDEAVENIKKLKKEIADLTNLSGQWTAGMGQNPYLTKLAEKKKELDIYTKSINEYEKAERDAAHAKEVSIALDRDAIDATIKAVYSKIKSIDAAKDELKAYQDSVSAGKEDLDIKNKLIDQYPEHVKFLYDIVDGQKQYTGEVSINTKAIQDNLNIQQSLARISLISKQQEVKAQKILLENELKINLAKLQTLATSYKYYKMLESEGLASGYDVGEQYNEVLDSIKEIRLQIKYLSEFSEANIDDLFAALTQKSTYIPGDTGTGDQTDEYTAQMDALQKLNEQLKINSFEQERNQSQYNLATDEEKNALLQERIRLLEEEQDLLHQINEARRDTIQQNVEKLRGLGFNIDYDEANNELLIDNMEHVNDLSNDIRKETEDLINATIDLNDANRDNSAAWWNVEEAIKGVNDEYAKNLESLAKLNKEKLQDILDTYKDVEKELTDVLKEQVEDRKDAIEDEYDAFKEAVDKIIEQMDRQYDKERYEKEIAQQQKNILKLVSQRNKLAMAAASGDFAARSKMMDLDEQIAEARSNLEEKQTGRERELRKQSLNDAVDKAEEEKNAQIKLIDEQFEATKRSLIARKALFETTIEGINSVLTKFFEDLGFSADEAAKNIVDLVSIFNAAQSSVSSLTAIGVTPETVETTEASANPLGMTKADFDVYKENKRKATEIYNNSDLGWDDPALTPLKEENQKLRDKYGITEDLYNYDQLKGFSEGGINTKPGMYMLHGTKEKPEFVFNFDQFKQILSSFSPNNSLSGFRPSVAASTGSSGGDFIFKIDNLVTINGNATPEVAAQLQNGANNIAKQVFSMIKTEFNKSGHNKRLY